MRSRHVSQVIAAPVARVYEFAADPDNLPRWAAGLARSTLTRRGDLLVAESPMGEVTVRFVDRNDLGVLDHDVTLPNGVTVTNPVRVLAHPDGAEVVFTLRQLDMSDDQFERDAEMVAADLARLRDLTEHHA
ncbi:SRPBCC family protein [Gordonia sp. NPDC003376]